MRIVLLAVLSATLLFAEEHPRLDNPVVFQRREIDSTGKPGLNGKLWIMEADGSHLRQITFGHTYDEHPSLLSDQTHALYAEFLVNALDVQAGARLVKLNIYTGEREILAEEVGCALHHATVSPIDDLIAYHRDCGERVSQWVGLGADAREIPFRATNGVRTKDGIIAMHEKNLAVSPREVSLIFIHGNEVKLLTDDKALHRRAAVSPDGERMAWQSNAVSGGDEILEAAVDGAHMRNLTETPGNDGHPWYSRDGQWLVFESDRSGNWEIWRMRADGSAQQQLTEGKGRYVSTRARM